MKRPGNKVEYVKEIETAECPVSAITAESRWILNLVTSAINVQEKSGGVMFGPDSSKWPAWFFAAVDLINRQTAKYLTMLNGKPD